MKCGKSVVALMFLLGLAANGTAAGAHESRFSAGSHFSTGGSHMAGGARIRNSSQFGGGEHFHGAHHFAGIHHRRQGPVVLIIAAPLFLSGYELAVPYPAPPAYIEQGDANTVWYYCDAPKGYYPDVIYCPAGWRQVVGRTPPQ